MMKIYKNTIFVLISVFCFSLCSHDTATQWATYEMEGYNVTCCCRPDLLLTRLTFMYTNRTVHAVDDQKESICRNQLSSETFQCVCYITEKVSIDGEKCVNISSWFYLYIGVIAFILFIMQTLCIYYIRQNKKGLLIERLSLRQRNNAKDNAGVGSSEGSTKARLLTEDTDDVQSRYKSSPGFKQNHITGGEMVTSNIYHSLDNLHIATEEPTSTHFHIEKIDKQHLRRISKRDIMETRQLPPLPTNIGSSQQNMRFRRPNFIKPLNDPPAPRGIFPLPHENGGSDTTWSKVKHPTPWNQASKLNNTLQKIEKSPVAAELNSVLNKRRIFENDSKTNQNQPNPPGAKSVLNVPSLKNPVPAPSSVMSSRPREPSPPSYVPGPRRNSAYSDDSEWTYEELQPVSIYNV